MERQGRKGHHRSCKKNSNEREKRLLTPKSFFVLLGSPSKKRGASCLGGRFSWGKNGAGEESRHKITLLPKVINRDRYNYKRTKFLLSRAPQSASAACAGVAPTAMAAFATLLLHPVALESCPGRYRLDGDHCRWRLAAGDTSSSGDGGVCYAAFAPRCSNPAPAGVASMATTAVGGSVLVLPAARAFALRNPAPAGVASMAITADGGPLLVIPAARAFAL